MASDWNFGLMTAEIGLIALSLSVDFLFAFALGERKGYVEPDMVRAKCEF